MYDDAPFVPFGMPLNSADKLAKKMSRKHGLGGQTVITKAREIVEAQAPYTARLILTWQLDDRLQHRDCQGRFPDLKTTLTAEYLNELKKRCDQWAEKNNGKTREIWVSVNGPVLCWRNVETGWTWLR